MSSINRKMANLITSTGDVVSSALDNAASMSVFSSVDSLPVSGLSAGDQALVGQRLYISNGSGWYNVALINATPTLSLSQDGSISLSKDGTTTTVITLTAADSDNSNANLVLTAESGGDFFKMATVSQDSSVFTITPRSKDSATSLGFDGSSTLTFKASDGIAFASNQVTFTLSFEIANSSYTSLLLQADAAGTDNQVDASTNTHTITEAGNVTSTAFTPYHPGGYSTYFDGTGDYLSGNDMGLGGAGAFTVEAWVYPTVYNTYANDIYSHGANLSVGADFLAFGLKSDGNVQMFKGSGSTALLSTSAPCATLNQWYHVAFVRESNNNTSAYVNGVLVAGPTTLTGALTSAPSGRAFIGTQSYSAGASTRSFEGYMRDVRIVNGTAVYTSAFTPPTEPLTAIANTSLLACHAPYIADGSTNGHAITVNGNTLTERFGPNTLSTGYTKADHGGSVYFDGTGDYLDISSSNDFAFGTGAFTVECWFYAIDLNHKGGTQYPHLICINSYTNGIYLRPKYDGTLYNVYVGGTSYTFSTTIEENVWTHIAVVRDGSGNLKLFENGIQIGSTETGVNYNISTNSSNNRIGEAIHTSGEEFKGYIKDVRVVSDAVYTSNFTPPTEPLTAITNTELLTCTNKNDIWDAGGRKAPVAKTGDVTASNTQRKFTTSSAIYLDGSGDNITMSDLEMGSGDLTFEFWMYQDVAQSSAYRCVLGSSTYGGGTPFTMYTYGSNVTPWLSSSGGPHISGAFTAFTWHHIALVRNSGTWTLYIDGTSGGTSTTGGTYDFAATADFRFGENLAGSYDWKGYIQSARFTKGLARYTGNFTPSTSEFEG